jgi:hypothetical protein
LEYSNIRLKYVLVGRKRGLEFLDGPCGPNEVPLMSVTPRIIVSVVAVTLFWSCGGGATDVADETAGREAFIGAYLALRSEAMSSGSSEIEDRVRDSILTVYDVTAQELLDFIHTHGEDVEFMRDLWTEIETRMVELLEQDARDRENEEDEEIEADAILPD